MECVLKKMTQTDFSFQMNLHHQMVIFHLLLQHLRLPQSPMTVAMTVAMTMTVVAVKGMTNYLMAKKRGRCLNSV